MTSRLNGYLLLTLATLLSSGTSAFADPQAGNAPVVITDQDLNSLSPEARREIQALIQHKQENPDPEPTRIRFGKNRGIVGGDIGPGGVDIQLLGGAIQIGGKNKRRLPQPVAEYVPDSNDFFPDDLIITMVKRGREPMFITVEKGAISFTIPAEKLEEMIDKYKPYVVQMLKNGLSNSGETDSSATPDSSPPIDLGAPATDLGEPAELPGPELGDPAPLPPEPQPEKE